MTVQLRMAATTMSDDERVVRIIEQNRINELKPLIHNLSRGIQYTIGSTTTYINPVQSIVLKGRVEMLDMAHTAGVLKDVRKDIINQCISIAYAKRSNPTYARMYSILHAYNPSWKPEDSTYYETIPTPQLKYHDLNTAEGYRAWMEEYPMRCEIERQERNARERYCKEHGITTYDDDGRVEHWGGR